jgi:hypothetical protein
VTRSICVSATKRYLIQSIARHHFTGSLSPIELTEDFDWVDAIISVARDQRDYFIVGDCDNRLPDGSCGGHDFEEKASEK